MYNKEKERIENFPENDKHYVAYTGIRCDNKRKVGGCACIILHNGKFFTGKKEAHVNTTNNRLEIKAIINAVALCPEDACIDIYTTNQCCTQTLKKPSQPLKNGDLWKLYKETTRKVSGARLHFKSNNGLCTYYDDAKDYAREAYNLLCETKKIKRL